MKHSTNEITVVAAVSMASESMIRHYADLITGSPPTRIHLVDTAKTVASGHSAILTAEIQDLAVREDADLIVCEWFQNPETMRCLLRLARELELPTVFIRPGSATPGGRLVVATGGGPNVCEQVWIAGEVATNTGLSLEIFHWQPDTSPCHSGILAEEQMAFHLLGTQASVHQSTDSDFVSGIAGHLGVGDVLVMGAPSSLRWAVDFAGSLPARVANRINNPLLLLYSPNVRRVKLRQLFWGGLIKPQMQTCSKEEAIGLLIDNLICHNQLPTSSRAEILQLAFQREDILSTAVDYATAFPHVKLPGFFGVAGSMGIFPAGIDFGSEDGSLTHYVVLLITPEGFSDEYLTALSAIARRMLNENVRQALLACESSRQALDVLEPCERAIARKEGPGAYNVAAGELRLAACRQLGWNEVPCILSDAAPPPENGIETELPTGPPTDRTGNGIAFTLPTSAVVGLEFRNLKGGDGC